MGDSFCTSSYDTDEIGDTNSANYIYIQRNKIEGGRVYEDPYPASSPKPKPRVRHFSQSNPSADSPPTLYATSRYGNQSKSVTDSPRLLRQSPRLPPRNHSPNKYGPSSRNRLRSKSPVKNIQNRRHHSVSAAQNNNFHHSQASRLSVKSVDDSPKSKFLIGL